MSEMIERVARAISKARFLNGGNEDDDGWDDCSAGLRNDYRTQARAAVEAMREPTKEMWQAGTGAIEEAQDFSTDSEGTYEVTTPSDYPGPCWRAMIDAALSTPSASERK
jgi:hypothetical protein